MNPSIIGQITEMKCQLYLIENGFNVLTPLGNHQKYDIVIEKNGKFTRIQIKHCTLHNDGKSICIRTKYDVRDSNKTQRKKAEKYTINDCDYFMTEYDNEFYLFPVFDTLETKLWFTETSLKTQKRAKDYLAKNVLQEL